MPTPSNTNPYDFISEVTDASIFAGRKQELSEVESEVARMAAPSPIALMIGVIGERRVGKTSFLHRVAATCERYGIEPVHTTLTSSSAADPREFWRGVIDQLLASISESKLCGQFVPSIFTIPPEPDPNMGFGATASNDDDVHARLRKLTFPGFYSGRETIGPVPPIQILVNDLRILVEILEPKSSHGIALLLDEAHQLDDSDIIQQQIRDIRGENLSIGFVFAGERLLASIFNDELQPLYEQAIIVQLNNFKEIAEITDCVLLPLNSDERILMSPLTIEYIARLSKGKPNQIRLICFSIFGRWMKGEQEDLDLRIETLEDIRTQVEAVYGYGLSDPIRVIQALDAVKLEILNSLTRYPRWNRADLIRLDESFRGDSISEKVTNRRSASMSEFITEFTDMGLLEVYEDQIRLVGDEFLQLYLRFYFEIKKYGRLSRKLELGKGPETVFGEKTAKLLSSIISRVDRSPAFVVNKFVDEAGRQDPLQAVKKRAAILEKVAKSDANGVRPNEDEITDLFNVTELVPTTGKYHLLLMIVRNLENPSELLQLEVYFEDGSSPLIIDSTITDVLKIQADAARLSIELIDFFAVYLPTLKDLLENLGGPNLDELVERADPITAWRINSVQRIVDETSRASEDESEDDDDDVYPDSKTWRTPYQEGESKKAIEILDQNLKKSLTLSVRSGLHNDRGYIRYGDDASPEAASDFERALDLHPSHTPLVLMNLAVIDIDAGRYKRAGRRIDEALFLTTGIGQIEVGWLRIKLLPAPIYPGAAQSRREQHPANVLEAAYVNLVFVYAAQDKFEDATDALEEGRSLLPKSRYLRLAEARLNLFQKQAASAAPIYAELAATKDIDQSSQLEIASLNRRLNRGRRR